MAALTRHGAPVSSVFDLLGVNENDLTWLWASRWRGRRLCSRPSYDGCGWAGDAFGKPCVQNAWLSGRAVAQALLS